MEVTQVAHKWGLKVPQVEAIKVMTEDGTLRVLYELLERRKSFAQSTLETTADYGALMGAQGALRAFKGFMEELDSIVYDLKEERDGR